MKYPFVIFYRLDKYSEIDLFFLNYASVLDCTIYIANSIENVMKLHDSNFHLLLTYGDSFENEYQNSLNECVSNQMLIRHAHIDTKLINNVSSNHVLSNVHDFNNFVNDVYIKVCALSRELTRPTFSLFTSSYNSGEKIFRVYNSLLKQTLLDWEWIILDDSPDDANFDFLRKHFINDSRIRLYRRAKNNGSIGNVKNETIGLCRGKYVLEMDHDDELMPDVLKDSTKVFENNPDVGFVYWDCASIYEDGRNQSFGDFICKGYGSYYSQKLDDEKWRLVYITPNINNITMTHLVCCPNHPRIWRRTTLFEMGSYSEYLPICDDYEIIVKTSILTKVAKVHRIGYIQYMNNSNNNFSLIRNWEINRIGPYYISPIYYDLYKVDDKMKELNAYEDEIYKSNCSKIWQRDNKTYKHKYANLIVNDKYDCQICILGLDTLVLHIDEIKELYKNERNDFILLDTKCKLEYLWSKLEYYGLDRMKCYTFEDETEENLLNYFHLLYSSTKQYKIINMDFNKVKFNTQLESRSDIINKLTNPTNKYLEIGVEYGQTFNNTHFTNKVGVDPDPKLTMNKELVLHLTSDEYFEQLDKTTYTLFDTIFIDGMHQLEYFVNDLNNSVKHLSETGSIFIDDILPFTYFEQLKIPINHHYDNNILKYDEFWTGDIWKVIYHIITKYSQYVKRFTYFYHSNFRGVGNIVLQKDAQDKQLYIPKDEIVSINKYDYFLHYPLYLQMLQELNK
uniref:Glycosyltransferase 2-like domain-containing protein n=1 Tax=viral metagenome TaxID=1070528 RepID=A0A6C0IXA8_9ZZZZ